MLHKSRSKPAKATMYRPQRGCFGGPFMGATLILLIKKGKHMEILAVSIATWVVPFGVMPMLGKLRRSKTHERCDW